MNSVDQDSQGRLYVLSPRGYSAYEIAVQQGFVGDEDAWLASLKGDTGEQGIPGKSAYQVAVDNGYEGTEEEWTESFLSSDGYYNKNEIDGKNIRYYDNVESMRTDVTLKKGMYVRTKGYYNINDGGLAYYYITDTADSSVYQESIGSLYANLISENESVNVAQLGVFGDNTTDYTEKINEAINYFKVIEFNEGTYLITGTDTRYTGNQIHSAIDYEGGLILKSGTKIKGKNTVLKDIDTVDSYNVIRAFNISDVSIEGIKIIGNRDSISLSGEYGHGIMILNSQNITIDNCEIDKCCGDGIYVGVTYNTSVNIKTKNVIITNSIIDENRRNGIACSSVDNILISNNVISNTNGTSPKSGIDIECEGYLPDLRNIKVQNNKFDNNLYGVSIVLNPTTTDFNSLIIDKNTFISGYFGIIIYPFGSFTQEVRGLISITNDSFIDIGWTAISIRNYYVSQMDYILIDNAYIINPNNVNHNTTNNADGWRSGSGIVISRDNDATGKVGKVIVTNLQVIDDRITKYVNKAFVVVDSTNNNTENIQLINPIRLDCVNGFNGMQHTLITDKNDIVFYNGSYYQYELNVVNVVPLLYTSGTTGDLKSYILNDDSGYMCNGTEIKVINDGGKKTQIKLGSSTPIPLYNSPDSSMRYLRCTAADIGAYVKIKKTNNKWIIIEKQGNWTSSNSSY